MNRPLLSTITEMLQSVVAHWHDRQLMTQRWLVFWQVSDDLTEQVAAFGFTLAFLIFRKEFTEAVETK